MLELTLSLTLFAADLAALDADSWRDREAATVRLIRAGLPVIPAVEFLAETSPSPEVRGRCRQIEAAFYHITPSDGGLMPWLCDGPSYAENSQRCRDLIRDCREDTLGDDPNDWAYERDATVFWVREELRRGVPRAEVVRHLDRMRGLEVAWRKRGTQ